MPDGRVCGPILLFGGSGLLLCADQLHPWLGAGMLGWLAFGLIALGLLAAMLAWHRDFTEAAFQTHAAMRHMATGHGAAGPARRVRIRIRCAR
ncbi:hypothetical protein BKE38_27475 [Pseudoroseomonas deserti]|uniref:Uncharacterized protein n=1 Tax=Teichococcus deserti TaxID=1817963 RepID=A0A1V2GUX8_9PROT|nr:hypothetical protein [Pseudoroseomonas deserti]ONG44722.1 hypothetical protein BKE38_27475 [Pseudoroseomonas deserti]